MSSPPLKPQQSTLTKKNEDMRRVSVTVEGVLTVEEMESLAVQARLYVKKWLENNIGNREVLKEKSIVVTIAIGAGKDLPELLRNRGM